MTGYSPSTVSKVFHNYEDVGEEAKEAIRQAAEKIGYVFKPRSTEISPSNTRMVAVIYDDWKGFGHPFFSDVLNSARTKLEENGYDMLFFRQNPPDNLEQLCREKQVDGILMISTEPAFHPIYRQLFQKFPVVSLNDVFVDEYSVISNNAQGVRKAMEYLIRLGHQNIALITGDPEQVAGRERLKEYRECLSENGIRFSKNYVGICTFYDYEEGYSIMSKLLERGKPTAVLTAGDYLCMGAVDYAIKAGYRVPEDISFIGFDDIEFARLFKPSLTTVRQNKTLLGEKAACLLLDLIAGKKPHKKRYLIDTELVLRESSTIRKGFE